MRIGVLWGAFDPVHEGHMAAGRAALGEGQADRVMFLIRRGDRSARPRAQRSDRSAMLRLAALCEDRFLAADSCVRGKGEGGLLGDLARAYPGCDLFFILGADGLACPEGAEAFAPREALSPVTSAQVRAAAALPGSLASLVPAPVESYIRSRGLYLADMSLRDIEKELERRLKPSRLRHTQGVCEMACSLAPRWGVSVEKARVAALLHDVAKYEDPARQAALARTLGDVDEKELASPSVVHAPAGSVIARTEFGVRDPDILNAIRNHTLGRSGMSPLEKLLFVCDFAEEGRREFDGLSRVRELARTDLDAAALACAELTTKHLLENGQEPHPRTTEWTKEASIHG